MYELIKNAYELFNHFTYCHAFVYVPPLVGDLLCYVKADMCVFEEYEISSFSAMSVCEF